MKYLNFVFIACLITCFLACNSNSKKSTHIEASESMDAQDDSIEESDEVEFLESAMSALDEGDTELAVQKIMEAVNQIKGYIGEMDDPSDANGAIKALQDLAARIKGGEELTSDAMEEMLLGLSFFSDEDIEFDNEDVDEN